MNQKIAIILGACAMLVWGNANAANGQAVAKAKTACQNNATQCAQAKSTAKARAQKEATAVKTACTNNKKACDNAKTQAKNAVHQ